LELCVGAGCSAPRDAIILFFSRIYEIFKHP
uniref:Rps16 n=1 Tax=Anisakis simplex TaxID=6269 RepID=A0A0M3JGE1_ANISI